MICFPNAKINIGLNIISKRKDNFHNIETVFYPVGLCDVLEIIASDELEFKLSGLPVEGKQDSNLCLRAFQLLKTRFNIPNVKIYLHKVIPTGAGLGGGSADAAFTLKTLNSLFGLKLSLEELEQMAAELGSDCSFFIRNKPVFAFEKGDRFEEIDLSLGDKYILIIKPIIHVNTAEAYSLVIPAIPEFNLRKIAAEEMSCWPNSVVNDFQEGVSARYPVITTLITQLYAEGALFATMSGSGSAVYGIFDKEPVLKIRDPEYFYWKGRLT